jgi:hypothetical protein
MSRRSVRSGMIGECEKLAILSLFLRCVYAGGVPPKVWNPVSLPS